MTTPILALRKNRSGRRRLLAIAVAAIAATHSFSQTTDPLVAGFANPPEAAKPRVWWHWMDGNVSEHGIRKDLAWLRKIGVGGVHNFDASLSEVDPPPRITERVAYLSDDWRK